MRDESNIPFPGFIKGKRYGFYGVDNNAFKLGRHVFEAMEDESDGFRSYLQSIELCDNDNLLFFDRPVAMVQPRVAQADVDGWELVDARGHVWLTYGTSYADCYYPTFVFRYTPKEN